MRYIYIVILVLIGGSLLAQTYTTKIGLGAFRGDRNALIHNMTIDLPDSLISKEPFRYGAHFAINFNDDLLLPDNEDFLFGEAAHFKANLGLTLFDNVVSSPSTTHHQRKQIFDRGRVESGIYFPTELWSAGDGLAALSTLVQTTRDSISPYGPTSCLSYRSGTTSYVDSLQEIKAFIGGRNSVVGDTLGVGFNSEYGESDGLQLGKNYSIGFGSGAATPNYDYDFFTSRKSISRFQNAGGWPFQADQSTIIPHMQILVDSAIAHRGFYNNFTHLHDLWTSGGTDYRSTYFEMLDSIRSTIDVNGVMAFSGGYCSIVDYSIVRESTDSIRWQKRNDDEILINAYFSNPYDIDTSLIEGMAISIRVLLTGTSLVGSELSPSTNILGIRKVATDIFIVDVAYDGSSSVQGVVNVGSGSYYEFTAPTISTATHTSGMLTVTSSQPAKVVVFYGDRTGSGPWDIYDSINSTGSFTTSHNIDVSGLPATGKDIYIGLINSSGKSSLSNVYRF